MQTAKNVKLPHSYWTFEHCQSDKVSRRCGKCPYRRKDWAEFPLHILSDKILLSRRPHSTGSGYIFVMVASLGVKPLTPGHISRCFFTTRYFSTLFNQLFFCFYISKSCGEYLVLFWQHIGRDSRRVDTRRWSKINDWSERIITTTTRAILY